MPRINFQNFGTSLGNSALGAQAAAKEATRQQRETEVYQFEKQAAEFELGQQKQQAAQQESQQLAYQEGMAQVMRDQGMIQRQVSPDPSGAGTNVQRGLEQAEQADDQKTAALLAQMHPKHAEAVLEQSNANKVARRITTERDQVVAHFQEGATKGWFGEEGDVSELVESLQNIDPINDPKGAAEAIDDARKMLRQTKRSFDDRETIQGQTEETWETTRDQVAQMIQAPQTDFDSSEGLALHRAMNSFRTGIYEDDDDLMKARYRLEDIVAAVDSEERERRLSTRPGVQRARTNYAALQVEVQNYVIDVLDIPMLDEDTGEPSASFNSAMARQMDLFARKYDMAPIEGNQPAAQQSPARNGKAPKFSKRIPNAKLKRAMKAKTYDELVGAIGGVEALNALTPEEQKQLLESIRGK